VKQALAATQCIEDNDRRVDVLNNVASALAHTTTQGDAFVGSWVTEVFAKARARGRDEVLAHIAAFSPVLAKLGVFEKRGTTYRPSRRCCSAEGPSTNDSTSVRRAWAAHARVAWRARIRGSTRGRIDGRLRLIQRILPTMTAGHYPRAE
jgi:hypothetical protein